MPEAIAAATAATAFLCRPSPRRSLFSLRWNAMIQILNDKSNNKTVFDAIHR